MGAKQCIDTKSTCASDGYPAALDITGDLVSAPAVVYTLLIYSLSQQYVFPPLWLMLFYIAELTRSGG